MERSELRQLVSDLVAIPSVNPLDEPLTDMTGEGRLAGFVHSRLHDAGIPAEVQEVMPGRPNVIARLPGERDEALLFDAHLDTVSGEGMEAPFVPRVQGDTLYARGAADDKGSLAAMIAALITVAQSGARPPATIILTATADEECRMRGLRHLLTSGLQARAAVVGEPTNLELIVAHKGVARFTIATGGKAAHSSRPEAGANAIYRMARVVQALEHYAKGGVGRESHALLGKATLSVGVIRGGKYVNVVPDRCEIDVDRRLLPGEDGRRAVNDVRSYLASAIEGDIGLEVHNPGLLVPALNMSIDDPWVHEVGAATRVVAGKLTIDGTQATTHAGALAEAGIPAVVLGPGSMGQAHTVGESLDLNQLEQAAAIYELLMRGGASA